VSGPLELYILRHAIAVERGTPGYEKDAERPLTGQGATKMQDIARGMRAMKLSFDRAVSSPYLRARQTAEIVCQVFGCELEFSRALTPEGNPATLIREIGARQNSRILLVGHEPYLTQLISVLIAGDADTNIELKKGGLAKLTMESLKYGKCATLEWLLTPKQLRSVR
jgi:phosphohistidine phosphatase